MSDSEGDISDELLELAGATERKRKKRQAQSKSSASKRRKADIKHEESEEDMPESEEEDVEPNPYPLEGKYIDEDDRQRLMRMSEIEREDILTQRLEEMQRIQDKRNLDQMLKAQSGRGEESVSKAAKRQHAMRGATKEKSRKLDELKERRKAKDEKKRTRTNSPKQDPSSSPVDMEMSDEEEEDGQISKYEEQEERERKMYDKTKADDEPVALEDLNKCRISRDMLVRYLMTPWFEDFVTGAWVRLLIGQEGSEPIYRICEVLNVKANAKPYKVNEKMCTQELELRHGLSTRFFHMDKVSNAPFSLKEFERLMKTHESEKIKPISKRDLAKKAAHIDKLANTPMTESDITAMLARKNQLKATRPSAASVTIERSRLTQARTLAIRRQDWAEVAIIDRQLEELAASAPARDESREEKQSHSDILAKVNERNRKANLEAVRMAEMREAERKRRERKLLAAGGGTPRSATPADLSARLKTVPKLFSPRPSAPGTPSLKADAATPRSVSPLLPSALSAPTGSPNAKASFEASVIQSVEIDLGDF
ncbi:hypothetical protein AcV5_009677 [Taiwanofungus camphoratus]|nr:hypothetical protein AcV5_009677 [Antrodia cinnamomea]